MARAQCSGSPLTILQGLRYATKGTLGRLTVTALYVLGYFGMGTLWAGALEKLLAPSRGGLWYIPGDFWSITLVVGGNPPAGPRARRSERATSQAAHERLYPEHD